MAFWLFGEDLVSGLVGPFASRADADAHRAFAESRGDADPGRVVDDAEADALRPVGVEISPEADRALDLS